MRSISLRSTVICVVLAAASATAVATVAVTVRNPSFATPTTGVPPGSPAVTPATCGASPEVGSSASDSWTTFANDPFSSIVSWLTVAPDGTPANLVSTGNQSGLVQVLAPQGTVTDTNRVTAKVYVLAGQASLQIGDGGSGGGAIAVSNGTLAWQTISACGRRDQLNNEIVLYGVGPSVFYVSSVQGSFDKKCL